MITGVEVTDYAVYCMCDINVSTTDSPLQSESSFLLTMAARVLNRANQRFHSLSAQGLTMSRVVR